MKIIATIITLLLCLPVNAGKPNGDDVPDSRKLGMAIDYFGGGKYHESLVLFVKLDKKYKLNPRFKAYIGICYYHEWEYGKACEYLDEAIPHLDVYSPAERNVYYNAAAESHFLINEYDKAIPLYERQLLVCHNNEKGDIFYRLGFCHMFLNNWLNASDYFKSALSYYDRYPANGKSARIIQIKNMIKGCDDKLSK